MHGEMSDKEKSLSSVDVMAGLISLLHLNPNKKYQSIEVVAEIDNFAVIKTKTIASSPEGISEDDTPTFDEETYDLIMCDGCSTVLQDKKGNQAYCSCNMPEPQ